jgi:hypothetical protein
MSVGIGDGNEPVASVTSVHEATVDVDRVGNASSRGNLEAPASVTSVPSVPFFSKEEREDENEAQGREAACGLEVQRASEATDATVVPRPPTRDEQQGRDLRLSDAVTGAGSQADVAGTGTKKENQQQQLLALAEDFTLFHDASRTAYAEIYRSSHGETWPLKASRIGEILTEQFYQDRGRAPDQRALVNALLTLGARAWVKGSKRKVFRRVGEHEGNIYLDVCDDEWRSVRIAPGG